MPRLAVLSLLLFILASALDADYELIFVNTIWRHGDRAPQIVLPAGLDKLTDDDWKQGGGGLGQLTTVGIKQQFKLGRLLRKRYIDSGFLSARYRANEIYVRSTDYNRTLVSAYSNLNGMYSSQAVNKPGFDFPSSTNWITNWVPIPVHTVMPSSGDYEANGDAHCKRLSQLRRLALNSSEYLAFNADPQITAVIDYIDNVAKTKLDGIDRALMAETISIEETHFADFQNVPGRDITEWYPWFYAHGIKDWMIYMAHKVILFRDGQANPSGINGIDIRKEATILRGGEIINYILSHVTGVLDCLNPGSKTCGNFFKKLKYFAISAHDVTLTAYLDVLGARLRVIGDDVDVWKCYNSIRRCLEKCTPIKIANPQYAAAMATEIYRKKNTGDIFFKVFYNPGEDSDFSPMTTFISGCPIDQDFCPFSVFESLAKTYDPVDIVKLCNTDL